MSEKKLEAPIPSKKTPFSLFSKIENEVKRPQSSQGHHESLMERIVSPLSSFTRKAKSNTPTIPYLVSGSSSDEVMGQRLKYYNLDFHLDVEEHRKCLYDPKSRFFSRDIKPNFIIEDCLPYKIETHFDRASYLCHVITNLYIAICSLDLEGLVAISSKDLIDLKQEAENLVLNTDMFAFFENLETTNIEELQHSDYEEDASGKITAKSASIVDVNHWTRELKNCLDFNLPLTLRKILASTYFYLSLVKGQQIWRRAHIETFESLVSEDDDGTNFKKLLVERGLKLNHKIIFDFLLEFLPYPDSEYVKHDISLKDDLELFKLLLRLADQAKPFFDDEDGQNMKEMMEYLISAFCPTTSSIILPIMTSVVPFHLNSENNIKTYLPFVFSLWTSVSPNAAIDTHMYDFVGTLAENLVYKTPLQNNSVEANYGEFGLFTEKQIDFIFNRLQNHLKSDGQLHSVARVTKPFIYAINGSKPNNFFEKFDRLLQSIETYSHPSNTGFWTRPIAKFIHCFVKLYHARFENEFNWVSKNKTSSKIFLTETCNAALISSILNVLSLGSQNKDGSVANLYISCFPYLLKLNADNSYVIYDKVLIDLNEALTGDYINSRHRVLSSLLQFSKVVRFMAMDRLYRIHITSNVSLLIESLNLNDFEVVSKVFNVIVSTFSFIPMRIINSDGEGSDNGYGATNFISRHYQFIKENDGTEKFEHYDDDLTTYFESSTAIFDDILEKYLNKLVQLTKLELDDGLVRKINDTTLIILESMDENLFAKFSKKLFIQFWELEFNDANYPNYEIITIPIAIIARRSSSDATKLFHDLVFKTKQQIGRGAGSIRDSKNVHSRDFKLVLYLTAMNDVLRQSHSAILDFEEDLFEFIKYLLTEINNPPLNVIISLLMHNAIASLVTTEVVDFSLLSASCQVDNEELWGALQFDTKKFDVDNMNFIWHNPNSKEINVALKLLQKIQSFSESELDLVLEKPYETSIQDNIQKYILVLAHAISGASLLFDPDSNKILNKVGKFSSFADKLKLLSAVCGKECDAKELEIDIEAIKEDTKEQDYFEFSQNEDFSETDINLNNDGDTLIERFENYSESPSGISTPVPGGQKNAGYSSMNSGIFFRELDIFSCNYYFGSNVEEKFHNKLYQHTHELRNKIGLLFKKIFSALSNNYGGNISGFQSLLYGFKVWFTDLGQETVFSNDLAATIDLEFLENIQDISGCRNSYTRTCLAVTIDEYHKGRVLLHSTNRFPSQIELNLFRDIFKLAISVYPDIHKPAQATLVHCMKQIVGSYSTLIGMVISSLEKALKENNFMQVEVILKLMMIKKVHHKLMTDYNHVESIIGLVLRCCDISQLEVAVYAEKILFDFVVNLKVPSSFCTLNLKDISELAPPDDSVKLQVMAVKNAKVVKRDHYKSLLLSLQKYLMTLANEVIDSEHNWKVTRFLIAAITKLQVNLEMELNSAFLDYLFKNTQSSHPQLIQISVKALTKLFNKIVSMSDYNHEIINAYKSNYDPLYVQNLNTNVAKFGETFRRQFDLEDNIEFFIDSKAFVGWLCWGGKMKVIKPGAFELEFDNEEVAYVAELGKLLNENWLSVLMSQLIKCNEARTVFSSGNVSFFTVLLYLSTHDLCSITVQTLVNNSWKYNDKYDKASLIISLEIFAAAIVSKKYIGNTRMGILNEFIDEYLDNFLKQELNQDSFEVWNTVCWWISTVTDLRRVPKFIETVLKIEKHSLQQQKSPTQQSYRLMIFRDVLSSLDIKATKDIPDSLVNNFSDKYEQVRQCVAASFVTHIQDTSNLSRNDIQNLIGEFESYGELGGPIRRISNECDQFVRSQFDSVFEESRKIKGMNTQDIMKTDFYYLSSTLVLWLQKMMPGPNKSLLLPYLFDYVIPLIVLLFDHRDLCKLSNFNPAALFLDISKIPLPKRDMSNFVSKLCQPIVSNSTHQIQVHLELVLQILSLHLLELDEIDKVSIMEFILKNLFDENFIEVRIKASELLAAMVHNLGYNPVTQNVVADFETNLNVHRDKRSKLSHVDTKIHGSILGLGAIIKAFPYVLPLPVWIPALLSQVSAWTRAGGMTGTAAKNIISDFKNVRIDTWRFDKKYFTSEQLEDLEGAQWRSYYA